MYIFLLKCVYFFTLNTIYTYAYFVQICKQLSAILIMQKLE